MTDLIDIGNEIKQIDWGSLHHAYGAATDVPDRLRGLLSPEAGVRQESIYGLFETICHQGSVYEASSYAAPILLEMLRSPEVVDKAGIALLLADLADGQASLECYAGEGDPLGRIFRESLRREGRDFEQELARERLHLQVTRRVVGDGIEQLFPYLGHKEPEVREGVARALIHYPHCAAVSIPLLEAALAVETEAYVRESIEATLAGLKTD